MVKLCPHCGAPITRSQRTCAARDCVGAESQAWLDARREAHARRMAIRAALMQPRMRISPARRLSLFERDDWTCHICTLPVARDAEWPHPLSAVVDHVRPLALGGSNDDANLATAHAHCNNVKSDRAICVS